MLDMGRNRLEPAIVNVLPVNRAHVARAWNVPHREVDRHLIEATPADRFKHAANRVKPIASAANFAGGEQLGKLL